MGWQMLVNHIETLLYTFPVLEEIFHMDQPDNRHVTIRGSTDPQDVSTVDFEDETSNDNGTLGTDTQLVRRECQRMVPGSRVCDLHT